MYGLPPYKSHSWWGNCPTCSLRSSAPACFEKFRRLWFQSHCGRSHAVVAADDATHHAWAAPGFMRWGQRGGKAEGVGEGQKKIVVIGLSTEEN